MARLRVRRPRRSTVVFVEAVLAVVAAAVAVRSGGGYLVAGVAALLGIAVLVRYRGRGLLDVARDRLRDPMAMTAPAPTGSGSNGDGSNGDGSTAADPMRPDLGLAAGVLPNLHVTETPTRSGPGLGVIGDGQGFAAVLAVTVSAARTWDFSALLGLLTDDPARPAAVQLLVEQSGPGPALVDTEFAPGQTYRSLPVRGLPLWNRVLLVIRHEPAWAPETVAARGGGAIGARNAVAAVAARAVALAARHGLRLRPLGAAEVIRLVRELGDPAPGGEVAEGQLHTPTAAHTALSVSLRDQHTIGAVLRAGAEQDVDRSVLSVAVNSIDHSACAVLRLVGDAAALDRAAARLAAAGWATPLPDAQLAGLVATLPLGGGARSLADLVNQERT